MAPVDLPLLQEPSHLRTPTMHPNLVSTLKSIICPPPSSPLHQRGGKHQPPNDLPLESASTTSSVPLFARVTKGVEFRLPKPLIVSVDGSDKRPQHTKQKQAAIVPIHLIQNRRPYKCGYGGCAKTFKNPQTLKMHHKTHCSGVGRNSSSRGDGCKVDMSGKALHSLATLPASCKAGQNKKIPSRCPVCKRAFVGLYELRRHFGRKHTEGEKSHACSKCGKRFYIEVDLRDHQKLCGEPLLCKCGMKFAFKCNLVAHKKTHPACQNDQDPLPRASAPPSSSSSSSPLPPPSFHARALAAEAMVAYEPVLAFLSSANATSSAPNLSLFPGDFPPFHGAVKSSPLQCSQWLATTPLGISRAL